MDKITNPGVVNDPREFIEGDEHHPATPLDAKWLNALQSELLSIITASGQTPSDADLTQLLKAIQGLSKGCKVDVFTSSGTWTKPAGAKMVHALLIGGGEGGGAGFVGAANGSVLGGDGGAGGSRLEVMLAAANFPATCAIAVGRGGNGGTAASRVGMAGNDTRIHNSTVNALTAFGGRGVAQDGVFLGAASTHGSATIGSAGHVGGGGAPSGGAGGGINSGTAHNGGSSVFPALLSKGGVTISGSGGMVPGGAGLDAKNDQLYSTLKVFGVSGGGGAAAIDRAAGNGGHGGLYGAGGGGGGAAATGFAPGNGGNGGDGVVVLTTFF